MGCDRQDTCRLSLNFKSSVMQKSVRESLNQEFVNVNKSGGL